MPLRPRAVGRIMVSETSRLMKDALCTQKLGRLAFVSLFTNSKSNRKKGCPRFRVTVRRKVRFESSLERTPLSAEPSQPATSVSNDTWASSGPFLRIWYL